VGRGCGFSTTELHTVWGRRLAVVERDMSRKVDWTSRADCIFAGCNSSGYILWGHLKKYFYAVPPRIIVGLMARLKVSGQRSIPAWWGVLERMSCGALSSVSKWAEFASNTYCNNEAPIFLSYDSLRHFMVTCILKTKRHTTHAVQCYRLFFCKQGITLWRACARILFYLV
jgi:hypothetical protein